MLVVDITLEDTRLHARRDTPQHIGKWEGSVLDQSSGKIEYFVWNDSELGAIVGLMVGGDDNPQAAQLYAVAEPLVKNWPFECRPIP